MNTIKVTKKYNDISAQTKNQMLPPPHSFSYQYVPASIFFNQSFDKKRLKVFLDWILKTFGEKEAFIVVEQLKSMGFYHATKAGLSIGLHDLKTPYKKSFFISNAQATMNKTDQEFQGAELTATERSQRIIDTWHRTSEELRKQVVDYFSAYDQLNSVYMMALSGARGNFSQVRQLIGMRGLMADPQGQMIRFPIRSNLREGLTVTEYFISCSGARKGLVDTALRTADTGYLTRRLVDISHHIVVKKVTCYTSRGIALKTLRTPQKILLPLRDRLIGRVLGENIYESYDTRNPKQEHKNIEHRSLKGQLRLDEGGFTTGNNTWLDSVCEERVDPKNMIAKKNQEISPDLAFKISLVLEKRTRKQNIVQPFTDFANGLTDQSHHHSKEMENQLGFVKDKTFIDSKQPSLNKSIRKNQAKTKSLVSSTFAQDSVLVRSPLTCAYTDQVCQLCYGWSMSQGSLVSLGEAVGVIAGQSIGEPGTQLTMRTFHTGGVFSGDLLQEIRAPHSGKIVFPKALQGLLIRTSQGKIAFLIKVSGELFVDNADRENQSENQTHFGTKNGTRVSLEPSTILFVRQGEMVKGNQLLAELAMTSEEGNQPIKSRQTLFSEIKGRIIQWKSMTSRIHRTKGISVESGYRKTGQILESKPTPDRIPKTVDFDSKTKPGVAVLTQTVQNRIERTCLGPHNGTKNARYSVFDRSQLDQAIVESKVHNGEDIRRRFDAEHSSVQHSILKNTVLAKKHGFGSIEPPKALTLGLLGVIATRAGASERTRAKVVIPNQGRLHNRSKVGIDVTDKETYRMTVVDPYTVSRHSSKISNKKPNVTSLTYQNEGGKKRSVTKLFPTFVTPSILQKSSVYRLNTVAEEGDLVDESYATM